MLLRKAAAPVEHGWLHSLGPLRLRQSFVSQALKLSRCLWIPPSCSLPLVRCNREGRWGGRLSLNTAAAPRIVPGCVWCKLTPRHVWGLLVAEQRIKSTQGIFTSSQCTFSYCSSPAETLMLFITHLQSVPYTVMLSAQLHCLNYWKWVWNKRQKQLNV